MSAGCQNCYAERQAKRLRGRHGYPSDDPFRVTIHADRLDQPLRWQKPRRIFLCSMSDPFHIEIPDRFRERLYLVMEQASRHMFQVLTKRADLLWAWFEKHSSPTNVWHGVTIENDVVKWRTRALADTNVPHRFLSLEPLLTDVGILPLGSIEWVIVGAESGPGHRETDIEWVRSVRDQCVAAGVPFFLKQLWIDGKLVKMPELDGRVWDELPEGMHAGA